MTSLDDATRALVRLAGVLATGTEDEVRSQLQAAAASAPAAWIEELILQTYLFAGFPRALNAMRQWRRIAPAARVPDDGAVDAGRARADGERTCRAVYGAMYEKLRENIRELHPALDMWMIDEGYGMVLSRPGLDIGRRELCIVAACAASGQDRQLQSHLHGARNVGVSDSAIDAALLAIKDLLPDALWSRATRLWNRIR